MLDMKRGIKMMFSKRIKSVLAGLLGAAMLATVVAPIPAARAAIPGAGQSGYASLHEYVSKTDIPGVYKVTLSLSGFPDAPPATEVVVLIDASASMNETAVAAPAQRYAYDSIGAMGGRIEIFPPPDEALYPDALSNDAVSFYSMTGTGRALWLYPLQGEVKDIGERAIPPAVKQPGQVTAPDGKTYKDTRIYTALTAAQDAIEAFFTPDTNPGADNTAVGVVTFSSNEDSYEYPFAWDDITSPAAPPEDTFY